MNIDEISNYQPSTPLNIIGVEKADEGEIEIAIRYFTEAIDLDPTDPKAYFNRATLRVKIGDIQGARSDFTFARNLNK
ncbi:MAG: tetratricopeptide repeat protein [Ignavibacteriaceae bacterium]|jgi:Flp pilus assembly protein TadD